MEVRTLGIPFEGVKVQTELKKTKVEETNIYLNLGLTQFSGSAVAVDLNLEFESNNLGES